MNCMEIKNGIYYVGVNDRRTPRFEGLWPLPFGVSYNSYIVVDDKVALIDTAEASFGEEYLSNVKSVIGDKKVDYLIINHMEPDHSGLISQMFRLYPDMKIIGNKITQGMVKGFYGIEDESAYQVMADGDTLSLGSKTLRFVTTPMVHWPETMMTFVEEDHLIFTGDAFGAFGALNGGVVDDQIPTDIHIEEMYRYYSNIVGKYGAFVQKALAKVSGLSFDYICSTHGPVWHKRIPEVVSIYNRLSLYEPEDGITLVYGSMYGNTERLAEMIARELCNRGFNNLHVHNASCSEMSYMISDAFRYKGLIIGSPTYSMTVFPPVQTLLTALQTREIKNKVFGGFGSYTWAPAAAKQIAAWAEQNKLATAAVMTMQQAPSKATPEEVKNFVDAFAELMNK